MMKKTLLTLGCAALAPLAFAQTSTVKETTTTTTTTTAPAAVVPATKTVETTTTNAVAPVAQTTTTTVSSSDGTVTTFEPGRSIVVRRVGVTDPVSYVLGKTVQYLDRAGRTIEASMVRPGVPVHVYYDTTGGTQVVNRVVVDQ